MKLIAGLGNPGEKYQKTRHNVGFMVVEQFLKDFEPVGKTVWENSAKFKSDIAQFDWQRRSAKASTELSRTSSGQAKQELVEKVMLVKPKTYMNNSGMAVALVTSYWRIEPSDVWIVHDDVDLPVGGMKIRFGGASAGHRGVTSIIEALKTDKFWRFRIGIGHPRHHFTGRNMKFDMKGVDEYVLKPFSGAERGKVKELIKRGAKALAMALEEGLPAAMNRLNAK